MEANKNKLDKLKSIQKDRLPEEIESTAENLGLDADHSSETAYQYLNSDNDFISENPDGEDDLKSNSSAEGHSPLNDK